MAIAAPFRLHRCWQRRISGLLSAALCVWLLAFSTHLHADDQDPQDGRIVVHFCGVCASIPTGAAAPAVVVTSLPADGGGEIFLTPEIQVPAATIVASYRSRAPPAR